MSRFAAQASFLKVESVDPRVSVGLGQWEKVSHDPTMTLSVRARRRRATDRRRGRFPAMPDQAPAGPARLDAPIFVVGAGRSGTTLLQRLLSAHSRIAIAPETHWLRQAEHRTGRPAAEEPADPEAAFAGYAANLRFRDLGIDQARWRALAEATPGPRLRAGFAALLAAYAERAGKPRVGEKTPGHVFWAQLLLEWFPDARLVVIMRDPRAQAASMMETPWGLPALAAAGPATAARTRTRPTGGTRPSSSNPDLTVVPPADASKESGRGWQSWNRRVLADITRLADLRWPNGPIREGWRDLFAFHAAVQIAHTTSASQVMPVLRRWAAPRLPASFVSEQLDGYMQSVCERAQREQDGETVEYQRQAGGPVTEVSPIYTYKRTTLLRRQGRRQGESDTRAVPPCWRAGL